MLTKHILYDRNACVTNLSSAINVINSSAYADITFKNNTENKIVAIKLNARGYNSFGETVIINDSPIFEIVIQDLNLDAFMQSRPTKILLPDNQIRKLDLFEYQTCFADGSVTTYGGKDEIEYDLLCFDANSAKDTGTISVLSAEFPLVKNYPIEVEDDWVCCCGVYNRNNICSNCHKDKTTVLSKITIDNTTKLVEKHRIVIQNENLKQKKKKKSLLLGLISGILILSISLFMVFHFSTRQVFFSEESIRSELQGTWTKYNASGDAIEQIIITNDKIQTNDWNGNSTNGEITWKPFWGQFIAENNEYVYQLEKDGTISCKQGMGIKFNFKKGGALLKVEKTEYESYLTALKLTKGAIYTEGSYTMCDVTITNNGKKSYQDIYVTGSFRNSSGKILGMISEYACEETLLAPGQSVTITVSAICSDATQSDIAILTAYDENGKMF